MQKILYVVHSIDTEGPLHESIEATFERLYDLFNIRLKPTRRNLEKMQNGLIDFGDKTGIIKDTFSRSNLNYNNTWEKLDKMLVKIMSPDFRNKVLDSFGNGWIYNWHCVDHVGYDHNPRRRSIGIHKVFDHYREMSDKTGSRQDGIHWHFHPMTKYKEAHRCSTSYINSPHLYEILCRRIIERNWFPAVSRAGFDSERPDSHWFLEQWVPFDISNKAYHDPHDTVDCQNDKVGGRFIDWRLAPDDWSMYHPSHDNYQIPGNCRRWICRILDMHIRSRKLSQVEVDKAFVRANEGKPTIMGLANHDERDMVDKLNCAKQKILNASKKYPEVKFKFSEAREAFRSAIYGENSYFEPVELSLSIEGDNKRRLLKVETLKGEVFGPQPFLAVKTKQGRFIHDNFDFCTIPTKWSYMFDQESIYADDISAIGIATNDKYGNTFVKVINESSFEKEKKCNSNLIQKYS